MKMTISQASRFLRECADMIESRDSFQGSIEWDCFREELAIDEIELSCAVRHGNTMGQGSIILIGNSMSGDYFTATNMANPMGPTG